MYEGLGVGGEGGVTMMMTTATQCDVVDLKSTACWMRYENDRRQAQQRTRRNIYMDYDLNLGCGSSRILLLNPEKYVTAIVE